MSAYVEVDVTDEEAVTLDVEFEGIVVVSGLVELDEEVAAPVEV